MSNIIQEFSRFAHTYDHYNIIQKQVAKTLVEKLTHTAYSSILDIGCGNGEVFKNIQKRGIKVNQFIALDSSENMLLLHPKTEDVTKVCIDFNNKKFIDRLPLTKYELILSSSALQWSNDLDFTLKEISKLSHTFKAAIFTSGTFKTLHKTAGVKSPIYSAEEIKKSISKYYNELSFVLHHYTLEFNSVRDMFLYIKKSGVSSGEKKLSYKETKYLMEKYPLNYLEFEVLYVEAISLA